jgi:general secretion pathway protein K
MKPSERGAALLIVLLLVGVMAALAVAVLDDIRFAVRRNANVETQSQAQWYALGAETLAKSRLQSVLSRRSGFVTLDGGWNGFPVVYPIDHGAIQMRLIDRGACFNLNSVVSGDTQRYVRSDVGAAQFRQLLTIVGVPDGDAAKLTDALVDWIDSDGVTEPSGAEDGVYLQHRPAYRTAGEPLAEETELRAIQGFTPEVYRRIRPYVCAFPISQLSEININTITPAAAPVLSAIYFGRLPVETARQLIGRRPVGGWPSQTKFLEEPLLEVAARESVSPPVQQLMVRTRYFALEGAVEFAGANLPYSVLLEAAPSGALVTVARRWSAPE